MVLTSSDVGDDGDGEGVSVCGDWLQQLGGGEDEEAEEVEDEEEEEGEEERAEEGVCSVGEMV